MEYQKVVTDATIDAILLLDFYWFFEFTVMKILKSHLSLQILIILTKNQKDAKSTISTFSSIQNFYDVQ